MAKALLADVLNAAQEVTLAMQSKERPEVYGDASYGTVDIVEALEQAGIEPNVKVQPPLHWKGVFHCALHAQCTKSDRGRTVQVHPKHAVLFQEQHRQRAPQRRAKYRATRPKVERKLAHLMRRKYGGRRARVRGTVRVRHDFALLGAAINLARLAKLGVSPRRMLGHEHNP